MTTSSNDNRNAWPIKQYPGSTEGYENYETDRDAWLVVNDFDDHINLPPPSSIPRVANRYTVADGVHDDPHGPPGTIVPSETPAAYNRRITVDLEKGKQCWARSILGYTADARATALTVPKHDARLLHATIKRNHGDKTSKQSSNLVTEFHAMRKGLKSIKTYNTAWIDGARILKSNGMELPPQYLVNLYLSSLGHQYTAIGTVVHAMPVAERTLTNVMRMAEDHPVQDTDEAELSHAMLSQIEEHGYTVQKRRKTGHARAFEAGSHRGSHDHNTCEICGMRYHTSSTCFADGGGLSHLNAQQRRTWIMAKRQAKADNQPMPTTWPLNQQPTAGGSASSAQTISDLELRLANRDAQIMKISSVYMGSPAHIDEFNTGLLAREWRPL